MDSFIHKISNFQIYLLFLGTGFLIYGFSLFNGFVADDNIYILENISIRQFNLPSFFLGSSYYSGDVTQLGGIYFKPFFTLIISLLFQFSGGSAFLFHLVQLLFHISNGFLLYLLFKRFFTKQISLLISLVFFIHPGNSESVVYISNLQDVLYPFFGLIALNLLFSKLDLLKKNLLISALLLSSLLSKESGILFLPTILILSYLKKREELYSLIISIFGVFVTYLFMRFVVAQVTINHQSIAPIMSADFGTRLMTMPKIIYTYVILFLFPKDLAWGHHWVVNKLSLEDFYHPLIVVGALIIIVIVGTYLICRYQKKLFAPLLFFVATTMFGIGLHLQFIPLDFTFADRWAYFPFIGFCGVLGVILSLVKFRGKYSNMFYITVVVLLLVLSVRTIIRTFDWKDDLTLTSHDVQVNTNSFVLENNLAFALIKKSDFQNAKPHLEKSIVLYPNQGAYNNLAAVYSSEKNYDKAVVLYRQSLTLGDFYMTYQNLIADLIRQKNYVEAEKETLNALNKFPNNPKLWLLMAVIYYHQGKSEEALGFANRANILSPGSGNFVVQKIKTKSPIEL
jgi:protein O-mannosyl-transferase